MKKNGIILLCALSIVIFTIGIAVLCFRLYSKEEKNLVNNIEIANLTAVPIIIYIIFLLYVYLYPNYKICLRAYIAKEKILSKLQNKYIDCIKSLDTQQEMSKQIYMVNLYNSIDYISKINIYPTSVNNIIMIFSTVILPAMFFFIDKLDFLYEPIFEKLIL